MGLDHKYDPLPLDDTEISDDGNVATTTQPQTPTISPSNPTIEIDAQHELLQERNDQTSKHKSPSSSLIVESMDSSQIDRDVARCTWHLLTGSQRSRRSQHKAITKNSTRGKGYARQRLQNKLDETNDNNKSSKTANRIPRNPHRQHTLLKYRRSRKVATLLKKKQHRLANLINLTLAQSYDRTDANDKQASKNRLRYYQGYHDVACIFLHALGGAGSKDTTEKKAQKHDNRVYKHYSSGDLELPSKVLCQVSFSHFTDALRSDFLRLQTGIKLVLFPLLSRIDRDVHDHLLDADMEPFFCLSWILTWFAHDVRDTSLVKRLFDAFLVGHPALPIYMSLAMICHPYNRQAILETDCDFAALHQCLASLPKHSCKVGYKAQAVEGMANVVVYVSDDEGEGADEASYLEDQQSEFGDDNSAFDNDSHVFGMSTGGDSIYTESSFPISVASTSQFSQNPTIISAGGASGSLKKLQDYGTAESVSSSVCPPTARTMLSTEEPELSTKDSTMSSMATAAAAYCNTDHNPVPFENVLDSALDLIKSYPPRNLVGLAKKYFGDDWDAQLSLLNVAPGETDEHIVQELIGLLDPSPPAWSILPSCSSDWMDKQKQRQDLGLKPTSRKDRRKRKKKTAVLPEQDESTFSNKDKLTIDCGGADTDVEQAEATEEDPMDFVRSNPEARVVVAIGHGPGMEAKLRERKLRQQRRRRKRRRALAIGCGVIVAGAVLYGAVKQVSIPKQMPGLTNTTVTADPPTRRLRQLRSLEDSSSSNQTGGDTSSSDKGTPTSPSRQTKNRSTLSLRPKKHFGFQAKKSAAAKGDVFRATDSTNDKLLLPFSMDQPILDALVDKTRLFLASFGRQLWIVSRGYFVSPVRFLLFHHQETQQHYAQFVSRKEIK